MPAVLRRMALGPLALLAAACSAFATAPPRVGPEPPPVFRGPDAAPAPLDRRIAADPAGLLAAAPDDWCPTGPDFTRWLERRLPGAQASARAKGGAGPRVTWTGGVALLEDDGTVLRHDRRPDLEGATLLLTPAGDDYVATIGPLAYEPDVGAQVLNDQRGWAVAPVTFTSLRFPFGGVNRNELWMTSSFMASFVDPAAPGPAQLHLADLIADRSPRIAPLQQGSSLGGWNAFVREEARRAILTWRASDGGGYDVDVQAILHDDGAIRLSWRSLRGVSHGSVVVVDGDDAWWNDRQPGGSAPSAPDEVGVPAPDGPAADLLEVSAAQVGGSEILQIELTTQAPLPPATDGTIQYVVEIRDEPGEPVLAAYWFEWEDGRFNWTYAPAELTASGFRFPVNRTGLALADDDVELTAWTATSWAWQQVMTAEVRWPSPPVPLMRDFSAVGGETLRGPLAEAFTLPELDVYAAHAAYAREFGAPDLDGLAVYTAMPTDIVFYAGAYSTVGNAGADGIGAGSSAEARSPALLHMSQIRSGWSSWDQGKVTVLNHEFGHRWLYFYQMMEGGVPTRACGEGHPAGWTHAPAATPVFNAWDASCMGGSRWTDNADGTFTSAPGFASFGYSLHELYLMGLADPSEVEDWFYLRDSVPGLPGAYWPPENLTATATRVDVGLQQVVDAMGPRFPAWPATQRDFIVPMVLVVRPGEWVQDDVDEVVRTCAVWSPSFNMATLGRGTVTCDRIADRPPIVQITEPSADVVVPEGTTLSLTGVGSDPDLDAVTLLWDLETLGGLVPGPGPHDVLLAEPGEYTVTLMGADARGRDAVPDVRRITVQCVAPPEMGVLRVARDRASSTLSFRLDAGSPPADEHVVGAATALPPSFAEAGAGALPVGIPDPAEPLVFYRLAGRNRPDCLGPW